MSKPLHFRPINDVNPYHLVDVEAEIDLLLNRSPNIIITHLLKVPPEHQTPAWRLALERCIDGTPLYDQIDAHIMLYGVEFVRDRLWRVPREKRNQAWLAAWELVDKRWWEQQGVTISEDNEMLESTKQIRIA